jgi:PRTRC genetic system ThiF family protein
VGYVISTESTRSMRRGRDVLDATIVLVGCGGTGGFLADALARLLVGRRAALYLVDPDRVGPENIGRQAFQRGDLGRFKAEVVAEGLAQHYGQQVSYSVLPYDTRIHAAAFDHPSRLALVVGAVDNAAARRAIATTLEEATRNSFPAVRSSMFWLDAGNGRNSGQVLLGNALRAEQLRGAFVPSSAFCHALPAPSMQRPDLLESPPESQPRPAASCANAVARAEQTGTINQIMAAIAASYLEKLLDRTCGWMATYVDMDDGFLQCVPADPRQVAQIAGLHTNAVVNRTVAPPPVTELSA